VGFCGLAVLEPIVPLLAGGPFLLPGSPDMPAPELFALGTETFGLSVCANAGTANVVNAIPRALMIRFMLFTLF
jgi:hypothetical protein